MNPSPPRLVRKSAAARLVSWIKTFLFWCSALETPIVKRDEFRIEHGKYVTIGLAVLITAVMAGFSGAYAINSLSLGRIVTISFGLLWGFIILNIDRQVIYGINSNNSKRTGGFGHTLRSKLGLLLRILLAVTIGFIISEPLKLRLFKSQIERAVAVERYDEEIRRLDGERISLQKETKILDDKLGVANKRIDAEVSGTNSFGVPGEGRRYMNAQNQADRIIQRQEQINSRIDSIREDLANVRKERIDITSGLKSTSQMNSASNQIKKSTSLDQAQPSTNQALVPTDLSLFEQIQILWRLQSVANKTSPFEIEQAKKIHEISLVITFLFLVIELLPVFSKLREALSNKPAQSGLSINLLAVNSFRADRALSGQISPLFWRNLVQLPVMVPRVVTRLPYSRLA